MSDLLNRWRGHWRGVVPTKASVPGCFASPARTSTTKSHLIDDVIMLWRDGQPLALVVEARCGHVLGISKPVRIHLEQPDIHDLCDPCIFADFVAPWELYRFFAHDGELLYVGKTCDFINRIRGHSCHSPWWAQVARWTREPFDHEQEVIDAEIRAIRTEHPRFNRQHKIRVP
jgi:hypothetical protein